MNLFDKIVTEALKNQADLKSLRIVVEKELLHHDILRILSKNNLLAGLTFIGGTCLRLCYGARRLSEDLDFTGGANFTKNQLQDMSKILSKELQDKYELKVQISEPVIEHTNVDTWKIKIQTRPESRHIPLQLINIDICAIPSYEQKPMLLINPYGVEMGTSGLIIQTQSLREIYSDKLLAFALRPNRIKYRDLWDILWLHQKGEQPNFELIPKKLNDRNITLKHFVELFDARKYSLHHENILAIEFQKEMQQFLPSQIFTEIIKQDNLWLFIASLIDELSLKLKAPMIMGGGVST